MRGYKFLIVLICIFFMQKSFGQNVEKKIAYDSLIRSINPAFTLSKDHYVKNLAFFCRQELKLEKAIGLPFRFRVGSLEQCNWM